MLREKFSQYCDCNDLTLDIQELSGKEGEIRTVLAQVGTSFHERIIWESSDENVVRLHPVPDFCIGMVVDLLREGTAFITARIKDSDISASCSVTVEPQASYTEDEEFFNSLKHYCGDMHTHTGYSDGKGDPFDAFKTAREGKRADFLAVSDHIPSITGEKWFNTLRASEIYTDVGFVAIPSFESGYDSSYVDEDGVTVINGGEINVLSTADMLKYKDVPCGNANTLYPQGIDEFTSMFKDNPHGIAFYNHPQEASWPTDKVWNAYNNFRDYTVERDKLFFGVEVSNETSSYNDLHELVYPVALDAGWHFSPISVSDTHVGGWTTDFDCRTVVLAPSLTRENIYDAFRKRRVYAIEDIDVRLIYKVNGKIMGTILEPRVTKYDIEIILENLDTNNDEKSFKKVEIISDYGEVVAYKEVDTHKVEWTLTLQSDTSRYYFVRAVNAKGKRVWSTPVWTGRAMDLIKIEELRGRRLDSKNWTIQASSELNLNTSAKMVIDGDIKTWWESKDRSGELLIDLGEIQHICGIGYSKNYIPYCDTDAINRLLDKYEFYISEDGESWGTAVAGGRVRNYGKEMYKAFPVSKARYVKIRALSPIGGEAVAIGEIKIYAG
jgi:hypothetical protein